MPKATMRKNGRMMITKVIKVHIGLEEMVYGYVYACYERLCLLENKWSWLPADIPLLSRDCIMRSTLWVLQTWGENVELAAPSIFELYGVETEDDTRLASHIESLVEQKFPELVVKRVPDAELGMPPVD